MAPLDQQNYTPRWFVCFWIGSSSIPFIGGCLLQWSLYLLVLCCMLFVLKRESSQFLSIYIWGRDLSVSGQQIG